MSVVAGRGDADGKYRDLVARFRTSAVVAKLYLKSGRPDLANTMMQRAIAHATAALGTFDVELSTLPEVGCGPGLRRC